MVPSKGILRGIAEGFLEFRSWGPDMGIFQKFWPTPRNPWVPHIWAPRTNFQKPFGYPTQNPLRGYHAKFQAIRHSSFFWRDPGYEKWRIFYYEYACRCQDKEEQSLKSSSTGEVEYINFFLCLLLNVIVKVTIYIYCTRSTTLKCCYSHYI